MLSIILINQKETRLGERSGGGETEQKGKKKSSGKIINKKSKVRQKESPLTSQESQ